MEVSYREKMIWVKTFCADPGESVWLEENDLGQDIRCWPK